MSRQPIKLTTRSHSASLAYRWAMRRESKVCSAFEDGVERRPFSRLPDATPPSPLTAGLQRSAASARQLSYERVMTQLLRFPEAGTMQYIGYGRSADG
jgi:hypothetical protein